MLDTRCESSDNRTKNFFDTGGESHRQRAPENYSGCGTAVYLHACSCPDRIQKIVLFEALVGRHSGINRAANWLLRFGLHGDFRDDLSRIPKNFGPFHRVPVIAKATFDRLG